MNKYLFAYNIRQNALLFLIILSVLLLYFSIIIPMYDPAGNEDLIAMASMKMSPEMLKAFGFTSIRIYNYTKCFTHSISSFLSVWNADDNYSDDLYEYMCKPARCSAYRQGFDGFFAFSTDFKKTDCDYTGSVFVIEYFYALIVYYVICNCLFQY